MVTDKKKTWFTFRLLQWNSLNQTIGANWLDDFDSFNKKPFVNKVIAKNNPIHFYSEGPQLEQIDLLILIVLT